MTYLVRALTPTRDCVEAVLYRTPVVSVLELIAMMRYSLILGLGLHRQGLCSGPALTLYFVQES